MDTSYYNRFGGEELMRRLSDETLLAQGPMGSVLLSEYDAADIPPAFWNLAEPQTVSRIHRLYVAAGAQVLITNTFQASSHALKRDLITPSIAEVNRGAVDDARQAHPQLLLGSMGPIDIEWFAEDLPSIAKFEASHASRRCSMRASTACLSRRLPLSATCSRCWPVSAMLPMACPSW